MANELNIFRDQMHREVILARCPLRMVSLVPSISELLFDLGLDDRVVGITKFCVHPAHRIKNKTIVGGTKTLKTDVISELAPDFIIGAKEENDREQIERLMDIAPVYMADVKSIHDAILLIQSLGDICGIAETTRQLSEKIEEHLKSIHQKTKGKVAYLIWQQPLMCAGVETYIHSVLTWMGFENIANALTHSRYPEISWEELKEMNPDKVFLSSEPYPFKDKHIAQFKKHLPHCDIRCVDGEMFSWYGPRMLKLKIPNEHVLV